MDIRIQKTETAIKNAFLELRSHKNVEKITVKELCSLAQINKSTFYSHYDDIYALADAMQRETIAFVLGTISQQEWSVEDPGGFVRVLFQAISAHRTLIYGLFSPHERTRLANALEVGIREMIYEKYPARRGDVELDILLSYSIQGSYHAFWNHQEVEEGRLIAVIERISGALRPLF